MLMRGRIKKKNNHFFFQRQDLKTSSVCLSLPNGRVQFAQQKVTLHRRQPDFHEWSQTTSLVSVSLCKRKCRTIEGKALSLWLGIHAVCLPQNISETLENLRQIIMPSQSPFMNKTLIRRSVLS